MIGTARPRGGCVAVTIEGGQLPASPGLEQDAARAAALIRHEMRVELAAGAEPTVAARQILGAAEPGEAAARAAWWSLAGSALPPSAGPPPWPWVRAPSSGRGDPPRRAR
ncbi:MAG: hypothetical protein WKG00_13355 [Polyangiaceae bacterium]